MLKEKQFSNFFLMLQGWGISEEGGEKLLRDMQGKVKGWITRDHSRILLIDVPNEQEADDGKDSL